jgi:hypothetical protein
MKVSTGLRNHFLVTGDLESGINGGVIRYYGSPTSQVAADALIPATADAAIGTATLLVTVSLDGLGTGINMDTVPSSGVLAKASGETWLGTMVASGYFSFVRFSSLADDGTLSTTEKRLQLTCGAVGKEVTVSTAYKALDDEQRLDQFYIGIPAE